jgi:hypothetical protein
VVKREARAFPEEFQRVFGRRCHGGILIARSLNPIHQMPGLNTEENVNAVVNSSKPRDEVWY